MKIKYEFRKERPAVRTHILTTYTYTHVTHAKYVRGIFFVKSCFLFFVFMREKMENFFAEYRVWIYDTVVYGCTPPKNKLNRGRCFGKIISIVNKCM